MMRRWKGWEGEGFTLGKYRGVRRWESERMRGWDGERVNNEWMVSRSSSVTRVPAGCSRLAASFIICSFHCDKSKKLQFQAWVHSLEASLIDKAGVIWRRSANMTASVGLRVRRGAHSELTELVSDVMVCVRHVGWRTFSITGYFQLSESVLFCEPTKRSPTAVNSCCRREKKSVSALDRAGHAGFLRSSSSFWFFTFTSAAAPRTFAGCVIFGKPYNVFSIFFFKFSPRNTN